MNIVGERQGKRGTVLTGKKSIIDIIFFYGMIRGNV